MPEGEHNKAGQYAPGELIVKFKPGVIEFPKDKESIDAGELICHSESVKALNKSYGLIKVERVIKGKPRGKGEDTFFNIYKFIFSGSDTRDMEIIAREYSKQPEVIYAEPNYIYTI